MTIQKTIIIAFECNKRLSTVLNVVSESNKIEYVIASRISDVVSILKTVTPALIIFGFDDNQRALSLLIEQCKYPKIPLLCLLKDNNEIRWENNSIIFVSPFEFATRDNFLSSYISSILMLSDTPNSASIGTSLIADNMRQSFVNQNDKLSTYVMELEKKKSVLSNVKKRIGELYNDKESIQKRKLLSILNMLKNETAISKEDDSFNAHFNRVRPVFLKQLLSKHPKLTPKDIKYCCYLCLNLSNHEIRNLLGINQESVRTHQYRLKKKMELPKNQSLRHYVNSLAYHKKVD